MEMPEKQSVSVMQAVYVEYGRGFLPIAFWQDGKSLLEYEKESESGQRWHGYDEINQQIEQYEKMISEDEKVEIYKLSAEGGVDEQEVDLRTLKNIQKKIGEIVNDANENIGGSVAATKGFSPNFAAPVRHVEYTLEEQQEVPEAYRQFVRNKLNERGFENTPVIIPEIWYVDIDRDGLDEAIISSTNRLKCYDNMDERTYKTEDGANLETVDTEQIAAQDGLGEYDFFFLYSESFSPTFLKTDHFTDELDGTVKVIEDQTLGQKVLVTKAVELEELNYYAPLYFEAQNGQIEPFKVMTYSDYFLGETMTSMQKPIILDWDGDGDYDLCIVVGSVYALFEVYIQEAGKLELQAGFYLPA